MSKKREKWLDPWSETFHSHSRPVREAIRSKDPQKSLAVLHEHLPTMIEIRDEVAALPLPGGFSPGLFRSLINLAFGIKNTQALEIEREASLQVWNEAIGDAQRELRRLESGRR